MRKQLPLLLVSALAAALLLAVGVSYWWVWAVWGVVVLAQIGRGLGWHEHRQPPYVPPHLRPDYAEKVARRPDYQNGPEWDAAFAEALARRERGE